MLKDDNNATKSNSQQNWPKWKLTTEKETYKLAQIITKYIRFLHPSIIEAITEDNTKHSEEWHKILSKNGVKNPDLYLWESSPCCFPGVRRYAGSKEIASFRKHTEMNKNDIPNALKLDDNDFPKQIWSFVFRGKAFNKTGPDDYSLAHLFDHKEYKNRMEEGEEVEFIDGHKYSLPYYGLYTCPSNTVYIPNSLIKPTDFNKNLRLLLFQKAESLYKDCCNILPPFIKISSSNDEKWDIENFKWAKCVGNMENIDLFLDYRRKFYEDYNKIN